MATGLPPLEYSDCLLDSPSFREMLSQYEKELEENSDNVKQLVKECRCMIQAAEEFSRVQCSFAQAIGNFHFQTIGEQTEDEKMILSSLQTFSMLLLSIEDSRTNMLITVSKRLLQTLENFRKEQIQKTVDEKRRFDRLTERYYKTLDSNLSTSTKKKEAVLAEVNSSLEREHLGFRQCAFDYVCKLQDVHAQKQFELIEPILGYISDFSAFLHQAYDSTVALKPGLNAVLFKIQILRHVYLEEQERAYELKAQIISEGTAGLVHHPIYPRQGHLLVQDNKGVGGLGLNWHRYFCQFKKQQQGAGEKIMMIHLVPVGHHGLLSPDFMEVKNVVRSRSDDVDRRFCFECDLVTFKGESRKYVMQASTEEDRRAWLVVMEGKEPAYSRFRIMEDCSVTPQGFAFVKKCIEVIESRGLDDEYLYRKPGMFLKAAKLVKDALERGKINSIDLTDEFEWDTETLASAIKNYFGKHLGEPLLTFNLHERFIEAAKPPSLCQRVEGITVLVKELPEANRKMLYILMEHLNKVSQNSDRNLMKSSNIGVVFGPTLMRPKRESVATVVNIKYHNIVVEVMVEWMDKIFCSADNTPREPVVHSSGDRSVAAKARRLGFPKKRTRPVPVPRTRRPLTSCSSENDVFLFNPLSTGSDFKLASEETSVLEQRLAEAQQAQQNLQRQLDQNVQAMQDLQRQASETEHHLQNQLGDERRQHESVLETLQGVVEQLRSQLSSPSQEDDFWNVPRGMIQLKEEIGIGGWGTISKGTFHSRAVAVKQLHPSIVSKENVSRLRREVRLMAHVRHPNILLFIAAVFDERVDRLNPPLIVMELLDADLRKAYKTDMISQHNLAPIFQDIACALNYLHNLREPIIHRDLSAPNVLLEALADNRWKAKVSDFGSANLAMLAQTAAEGAILYLAPECLPEEIRGPSSPKFPQTPKVDVYSFGVLICEVVTCSLPTQLRQMKAELKSRWPFMHGLADICMNYSPNDRPTMLRILTELKKSTVYVNVRQ